MIQELTSASSPLRDLRESLCASRADFCRRHGLGYQSVTLAEVGLVPNPARLIEVLARLTGRKRDELLQAHKTWLEGRTAS